MNRAYLAIVGALTALMLFIFLATGQPLDLTATAVVLTGGLALGAAYIYSREEAYEEAGEGDWSEYADDDVDEDHPTQDAVPSAESPEPETIDPAGEAEDDISSPS